MINSLRKRDSNPPNYSELERNTIPQLQKILYELKVVPPATTDRDELIRLIKLKITPRRAKNRKMYQRPESDSESSTEDESEENDNFNVSKDQFDDAPIQIETTDNQQNSDLNLPGKDENIPSAESMMADDEFSNSAFDAESSIVSPQRDSQPRLPTKLFPSKPNFTRENVDDGDKNDETNNEKADEQLRNNSYQISYSNSDVEWSSGTGWSSSNALSPGSGWGSSSERQSPQRRTSVSPSKPGRKHNHQNSKPIRRQKVNSSNDNIFSTKLLLYLLLLFLLFLLLFFLLLALIPLPGENRYLTHCPKHATCNEKQEGNITMYTIKTCDANYVKMQEDVIQVCAPKDQMNTYRDTLKAASYISHTNGDCFFNSEYIDIEHIRKRYSHVEERLLLDPDFYTVKERNNFFRSLIIQYEPTCRAFHACDDSPAFTGLIIILCFIASYMIVRHYSHQLNSIA